MFTSLSKCSLAIAGLATVVGMTSFLGVQSARAEIINGDFNSGFSGWLTLGDTNVEYGVAVLNPEDGNASKRVDFASIESFLGLSAGTLAGVSNTTPADGSAIKQSFFASAGTKISFDWLFYAGDYLPFNDFAFYSLVPDGEANLLSNVVAVRNFGNSGQQSLSFVIPTSGNYTLGFGVLNAIDKANESRLVIDNVSAKAVPEPALISGLIGVGVVKLRKRKTEAIKEASEA